MLLRFLGRFLADKTFILYFCAQCNLSALASQIVISTKKYSCQNSRAALEFEGPWSFSRPWAEPGGPGVSRAALIFFFSALELPGRPWSAVQFSGPTLKVRKWVFGVAFRQGPWFSQGRPWRSWDGPRVFRSRPRSQLKDWWSLCV